MANKKKNKKSTVGRPTKLTPSCLQKLKEGFLKGYNNREACIYAELVESTFYKYCDENPNYVEKREVWKKAVNILAKDNLVTDIKAGDNATSKWWLERKAKDEFSIRNETTGVNGLPIEHTEVTQEEVLKRANEMRNIKDGSSTK